MSIENRGVSTSVYYKPTDSHAYLHYHSNHSSLCKNAIPYSQFLRLRRLYSETDDFSAKSEEMCRFFYDKGYPLTVVSSALAKARSVSRDSLLSHSNVKESVRKVPLILDFNSYNKKVMSIVRRNFEQYLTGDVDIGKMFDSNFLGSFSNEKSLANHLVSSRLSAEYEIPGTFQCNRSVCNTCAYVSSATVIVGPFDTFDIRQSFSCTSDNIVY